MQKFQDYIFSSPSVGLPRPVPNATVLVLNYPAMTVATIYSDNGITTTANPFLSAGDGKIAFYAADGHYSVQVSGQGINGTPTTNDILLEDGPADFVTLAQLSASSGSSLVGYTQGAGALTKTVQSKLRSILSLNDFAAFDGVTDDTANIIACITANPNRTIRASGFALTSASILLDGRQKLIFEGGPDAGVTAPPASGFIKKSTMTTPVIIVGAGSVVEGGGVDCSHGGSGGAIQLRGNTPTCRNVTVFGFPGDTSGDGFRVGDTAGTNTNSWLLDSCNATGFSGHGFHINDGSAGQNVNAGTALRCQALSNGGDGFRNNNAAVNTFVACLSELNTGAGIRMGSLANINFIYGGDYEVNTGGNVVLDAGSVRTTISIGSITTVVDNSDATTGNSTVRLDRLIQHQGTWVPLLAGSSTAGTQTYSIQNATYMRCGDMCFITTLIVLTALDAATAGNIRITGLPYAYPAGFTNGIIGCSVGSWGGMTLTANYTDVSAKIDAGNQFISLLINGSAQTSTFLTKAMISATTNIQLSAWYPIAQF